MIHGLFKVRDHTQRMKTDPHINDKKKPSFEVYFEYLLQIASEQATSQITLQTLFGE